MAKHAYLAASASERWLHCPPSAKLCAQEEYQGSPYAQQGTDAHELCQHLLEKALGRQTRDPTEDLTYYDQEMQECAEGYASLFQRYQPPNASLNSLTGFLAMDCIIDPGQSNTNVPRDNQSFPDECAVHRATGSLYDPEDLFQALHH